MKIPFTVEQFFEVFARYNEGVWPTQIILSGLALAAIVLVLRPRPFSSPAIAAILSFLWGWMAIAYHFAFFASINPAAWLFGALFLAGSLWFAWEGVINGRLQFRLTGGIPGGAGVLLIIFSLIIYPLLGCLLGHRYPAVPTFGLPCPTTIFTLGLLLFAAAPLPRSVFVVPLLWSATGSLAAFRLGVLQDLGLLAAGLIGLAAVVSRHSDLDANYRAVAEQTFDWRPS
jgi:hypothetical protein